jgi:anti-anti-sigma factor
MCFAGCRIPLARALRWSIFTMLRITVNSNGPLHEVKVEGRIAGSAVEELREVCEKLLADRAQTRVVLDVGEVSFADVAGITLFRDLRSRDVVLVNRTPFLAELLKEVVPCS